MGVNIGDLRFKFHVIRQAAKDFQLCSLTAQSHSMLVQQGHQALAIPNIGSLQVGGLLGACSLTPGLLKLGCHHALASRALSLTHYEAGEGSNMIPNMVMLLGRGGLFHLPAASSAVLGGRRNLGGPAEGSSSL